MERTEFMSHGMAHAEESICESHTGHRSRIGHLLSRFHVCRSLFISSREILKDRLQCLDRQAVRIIRCHHGSDRFKGMGHSVNTGGSGQTLWSGHMEIRIDDCHIRKELVIRQRILNASLLIRNDREGSYLRTGTGGCGDRDKVSLLSHLGEGVDTLADIHEAHGHIHEIRFRMFIEHPHDLSGIHGGAAAQSDNDIRLEGCHLCCTGFGAAEGRIRFDFEEAGMRNAHLVQLVRDRFRVAVLVEETVGHDKCPLLSHHGFQFIKSYRQASFLDVHLLRCPEPQHVFSPFRHCLNIQKMLDSDIFGYGVSAPGSAPKSE